MKVNKIEIVINFFFIDSSVAIIVYDITSAASFQVLKNWIEEINEKGPKDIVIAIAGNKCDLVEKEEVSYDEAFKYAKVIILYYLIVFYKVCKCDF